MTVKARRRRTMTVSEVISSAVKARESLNMARRLAAEGSAIEPVQDNGGPPTLTRVRLDKASRLRRAQAALAWVQQAEDQVRHLRIVLERMIEELEKEATWH